MTNSRVLIEHAIRLGYLVERKRVPIILGLHHGERPKVGRVLYEAEYN